MDSGMGTKSNEPIKTDHSIVNSYLRFVYKIS